MGRRRHRADVAVLGDLPQLTSLLAATQRLIPHVVRPDDADQHTAIANSNDTEAAMSKRRRRPTSMEA